MSAENVQQGIVTYHVFIKNGYRHYAPQYFAAFAQWVFPIAKPNTIGTLDECGNCIESISFGKYGVEQMALLIINFAQIFPKIRSLIPLQRV